MNFISKLTSTSKYMMGNTSTMLLNNSVLMNQGRLSFNRLYSSSTLSEELKKKIDGQVGAAKCVLYMKGTPQLPQCGFSNTVVRILDAEGAVYNSHNILIEEDLRSAMKEYSNWPTFPQVYIGGEFVGGADIMMNMYKSGELSKLLEQAGAKKSE